MADEELKLRITAEAAQAEAALKKTQGGLRGVKEESHGAASGLGQFKSQLVGMAAGAVGISAIISTFRQLVAEIKTSERAFLDFEKLRRRLGQVSDLSGKEILAMGLKAGVESPEAVTSAHFAAASALGDTARARQLTTAALAAGPATSTSPATLVSGATSLMAQFPNMKPTEAIETLAAGARGARWDIETQAQYQPRLSGAMAASGASLPFTLGLSAYYSQRHKGEAGPTVTETEAVLTRGLTSPRNVKQKAWWRRAKITDADGPQARARKLAALMASEVLPGPNLAGRRQDWLRRNGVEGDELIVPMALMFADMAGVEQKTQEISEGITSNKVFGQDVPGYQASTSYTANQRMFAQKAAKIRAQTHGISGVIGDIETYLAESSPTGDTLGGMIQAIPMLGGAVEALDVAAGSQGGGNVINDNSTTVIHNNGTQSTTERVTGGSNAIPGPGD